MPFTDQQLLSLLQTRQPAKARDLAQIINKEFGLRTDRSDVNQRLYKLARVGKVYKRDDHQWQMASNDNENSQSTDTELPEPPKIQFTERQQALIDLDPSNHLLIRGQAGSGKTTVLAARARKTLSAMNEGSLLFLTYNTALAAKVQQELHTKNSSLNVLVTNYHDWAKNTAIQLGATFADWINQSKRKEALKSLVRQAQIERGGHRLYDYKKDRSLLEWYGEEIAWLFGQHITRLEEYEIVERAGRGTLRRLRRDERKYVWTVFELYEEWLEEENAADYDNPAGLILRSLMQSDGNFPDEYRYDHVMVDEVQDFDRSWLLAVVPSVRVSLTLAGDLAQRIYKRNFTWSSVGINVQGKRSQALEGSFRSTRQTLLVAEYLLKDNDVKVIDDYESTVNSEKNGEKVFKINKEDSKAAYAAGYDWVASRFKEGHSGTVAVALPFSNQVYAAASKLSDRGLVAKALRGKALGTGGTRIITTTYHQLKGLEFDHVVIMGLNDDQFPGRLVKKFENPSSEQDAAAAAEDLKQESDRLRRLLYVAMTRSRKSTTLVGSEQFCRFFDDVPDWAVQSAVIL